MQGEEGEEEGEEREGEDGEGEAGGKTEVGLERVVGSGWEVKHGGGAVAVAVAMANVVLISVTITSSHQSTIARRGR